MSAIVTTLSNGAYVTAEISVYISNYHIDWHEASSQKKLKVVWTFLFLPRDSFSYGSGRASVYSKVFPFS